MLQNYHSYNKQNRLLCGAKTRKGTPCKAKAVLGKNRCRIHGGLSTGAKTPEGIERIRKAQERRWAIYKASV